MSCCGTKKGHSESKFDQCLDASEHQTTPLSPTSVGEVLRWRAFQAGSLDYLAEGDDNGIGFDISGDEFQTSDVVHKEKEIKKCVSITVTVERKDFGTTKIKVQPKEPVYASLYRKCDIWPLHGLRVSSGHTRLDRTTRWAASEVNKKATIHVEVIPWNPAQPLPPKAFGSPAWLCTRRYFLLGLLGTAEAEDSWAAAKALHDELNKAHCNDMAPPTTVDSGAADNATDKEASTTSMPASTKPLQLLKALAECSHAKWSRSRNYNYLKVSRHLLYVGSAGFLASVLENFDNFETLRSEIFLHVCHCLVALSHVMLESGFLKFFVDGLLKVVNDKPDANDSIQDEQVISSATVALNNLAFYGFIRHKDWQAAEAPLRYAHQHEEKGSSMIHLNYIGVMMKQGEIESATSAMEKWRKSQCWKIGLKHYQEYVDKNPKDDFACGTLKAGMAFIAGETPDLGTCYKESPNGLVLDALSSRSATTVKDTEEAIPIKLPSGTNALSLDPEGDADWLKGEDAKAAWRGPSCGGCWPFA